MDFHQFEEQRGAARWIDGELHHVPDSVGALCRIALHDGSTLKVGPSQRMHRICGHGGEIRGDGGIAIAQCVFRKLPVEYQRIRPIL